MVSTPEEAVRFNGSNWQDLTRAVALARFAFLQDDDYDKNEPRRCAYLASQFVGPALDWVVSKQSTDANLFNSFDAFVTSVRNAFGINDANANALLCTDFDSLRWEKEVPIFFAEFERMTLALGITSDTSRSALLDTKLPMDLKKLLASEARVFGSYAAYRDHLIKRWALDPTRTTHGPTTRKNRCGHCGKKNHTSSECRSKN